MSTSISQEAIQKTVLQNDVFEPSYELVNYAFSHLDDVSKDRFIVDILDGNLTQGAFKVAKQLGVIPEDQPFLPAIMYDTWTVEDVIELDDTIITSDQASCVLISIFKDYDSNEGINNDVVFSAADRIKSSPLGGRDVLFHPDVNFVREILSKINEAQKERLMVAIVANQAMEELFETAKSISMIPQDQTFLPFSKSMPWTTYDVRMEAPGLSEKEASEVLLRAFNDFDSENGISYASIRLAFEALHPETDFILPATVSWTDKDGVVRGESVYFNLNNGDILDFSQAEHPDVQDLTMVFAGCDKVFECASTTNVVFSDHEELIGMRDMLEDALGEAMLQDLMIKTNLHVVAHDSSPSL